MLMVFLSLGGPRGGATLKRINYREIDMEIDDKTPFGRKLDYLKLSLKISKLRYHGDEPSQALLKKALKLGRLAGISEEELLNLCSEELPA